jgi:sugar lactone lactonase YvrE
VQVMAVELSADLLVEESSQLGEGPVWDPRAQQLWWVDITGKRLHSFFPAEERRRDVSVDRPLGAIALREQEGLIAAVDDGFALLDGQRGSLELIAPVEADNPRTRMNDGKCDHAGRFWAGTMAYDGAPGAGSLYCLEADRVVRKVLDGVTISNGLAWTDSARLMYYIDTPTRRVDVFDYDIATGDLSGRRPFVELEAGAGSPDGMTIDEDGCIWVAMWDGWSVNRYTPDGRLDRIIRLPVSRVTSCTFGGPNLKDLYITSASEGLSGEERGVQPLAGSLFVCSPGATGVPPATYAG